MIYAIPKPVDGIIVTISQWSIREVIYGDNKQRTHHLVGYIPDEGAGRVTSVIQTFNKENKIITTRSGRIYKLYGAAGTNDDAQYVWESWMMFNDAREEVDVTKQYFNTTHFEI